MQKIIAPINKDLLVEEISRAKFVRKTNKDNNLLYIISWKDSPNLMREIGRLREISYRKVGSGTGKDCDIDSLDKSPRGYKQLIVWDPAIEEILGGYRFMMCAEAEQREKNQYVLGTSRLFSYSDEFIEKYLPHTIELGRSFIQPQYQSTESIRKSLFVLDNLWDGLGSLLIEYPSVKYFLGQVSLFTTKNVKSRELILHFLRKFFPNKKQLVSVNDPVRINIDSNLFDETFNGNTLRENIKILSREVRKLGETIPPLINIYMNISPTMQTFGTVSNPYFKHMDDTGILMTIDDIYTIKKERHLK
jgi:hypothetical protein